MKEKLKSFAVISQNLEYAKSLCQELLSLCRENGCNFLFCAFQNTTEFYNRSNRNEFTHVIVMEKDTPIQMVEQLSSMIENTFILLLTQIHSDALFFYRYSNIPCFPLPQDKADLAGIMNLLYGERHRFHAEGRAIRILSIE